MSVRSDFISTSVFEILQEGVTTDSEGDIPGDDPSILGNEGTFDEEEGFRASKSLWD